MTQVFRPPALQHLVLSLRESPETTAKQLIKAHKSRAPFSYQFIDGLIRKLLQGGNFSLEQICEAIKQRQKVPEYQSKLLEIAPLLYSHFANQHRKYVVDVPQQIYRLEHLEIPFRPAFAIVHDNQITIPWFIYWKRAALAPLQRSLLVTLIRELLSQEPDFSDSELLLYSFCAPEGSECRELSIDNASATQLLSDTDRDRQLRVLLEGIRIAEREISQLPDAVSRKSTKSQHLKQSDLFDDTLD